MKLCLFGGYCRYSSVADGVARYWRSREIGARKTQMPKPRDATPGRAQSRIAFPKDFLAGPCGRCSGLRLAGYGGQFRVASVGVTCLVELYLI